MKGRAGESEREEEAAVLAGSDASSFTVVGDITQ